MSNFTYLYIITVSTHATNYKHNDVRIIANIINWKYAVTTKSILLLTTHNYLIEHLNRFMQLYTNMAALVD